MNAQDYVKRMKVVQDRDDVTDAQSNIIQEISSKTLPILASASAMAKIGKLKSKEAIHYDELYRARLGLRGGDIFTDMKERMENMRNNMEFVNQESLKIFGPTIARDNVTVKQVTLLQLTDAAVFASRYARRFTDALVIYETAALPNFGKQYMLDNLSKGDAKYVESRFAEFVTIAMTLGEDPIAFKKKFAAIPDVNVGVEDSILDSIFKSASIDPYRMGFLATPLNPIFLVMRWLGELQVARMKEAQEDLAGIQRRILMLEEANAGKGNPKLEKEIEEYRRRAEKLTVKLNKFEEELAA